MHGAEYLCTTLPEREPVRPAACACAVCTAVCALPLSLRDFTRPVHGARAVACESCQKRDCSEREGHSPNDGSLFSKRE